MHARRGNRHGQAIAVIRKEAQAGAAPAEYLSGDRPVRGILTGQEGPAAEARNEKNDRHPEERKDDNEYSNGYEVYGVFHFPAI